MVFKFFSAWFCPYAQRAWLVLEHHQIPFEYIESLTVNKNQEEGDNGYTKNARLLQLNPKGLVPTLEVESNLVDILEQSTKKMLQQKEDTWVMTESIDCMVFLNKVAKAEFKGSNDLIPDPDSLKLLNDSNTFNQNICSTFYKILMKPTREEQKEAYVFFVENIALFLRKVRSGGFYDSETPTIVDFTVIPWFLRIPLLEHYRPIFQLDVHLKEDDVNKLKEYLGRVRGLDAVKKTLWGDENDLIEVYKRYADGSATSQVGKAVSSGKNAHDI